MSIELEETRIDEISKIMDVLEPGDYKLEDKYLAIRYAMSSLTEADLRAFLPHAGTFCDKCGRCCTITDPPGIVVSHGDIKRMSKFTEMSPKRLRNTYIRRVGKGLYIHKGPTSPCPFLSKDTLCTIYACRPTVCSQFPFNLAGPNKFQLYLWCRVIQGFIACKAITILSGKAKKGELG